MATHTPVAPPNEYPEMQGVRHRLPDATADSQGSPKIPDNLPEYRPLQSVPQESDALVRRQATEIVGPRAMRPSGWRSSSPMVSPPDRRTPAGPRAVLRIGRTDSIWSHRVRTPRLSPVRATGKGQGDTATPVTRELVHCEVTDSHTRIRLCRAFAMRLASKLGPPPGQRQNLRQPRRTPGTLRPVNRVSRVTALLYLPDPCPSPVPAIVVACGHGGSKCCLYANTQDSSTPGWGSPVWRWTPSAKRSAIRKAAWARATISVACRRRARHSLAVRLKRSDTREDCLGSARLDYLQSRPEVDGARLGILGYSLGGATAGCVAIRMSGSAPPFCAAGFTPRMATYGKDCTRCRTRRSGRSWIRRDDGVAGPTLRDVVLPATATPSSIRTRADLLSYDTYDMARSRRATSSTGGSSRSDRVQVRAGADHRPRLPDARRVRGCRSPHEGRRTKARSRGAVRFGDWWTVKDSASNSSTTRRAGSAATSSWISALRTMPPRSSRVSRDKTTRLRSTRSRDGSTARLTTRDRPTGQTGCER